MQRIHNIIGSLQQVSVPVLERALHQYTLSPSNDFFDMSTVPVASITPVEDKVTAVATEGIITPGLLTFWHEKDHKFIFQIIINLYLI